MLKPIVRLGDIRFPANRVNAKAHLLFAFSMAALPYRFTSAAALEIFLITSRRTKRWIIPKGWPIKGLKPAKTAARGAFEEAGVRESRSEARRPFYL